MPETPAATPDRDPVIDPPTTADPPALDVQVLLERSRFRGTPVAWEAIVGHEAAKRELAVVVETVRRHSVAERLGLEVIKGVLISGPAGAGKTMLAKALATAVERQVYVLPSSEVDAATIRGVYEALAGTPCCVIWDEADLILRNRFGRTIDGGKLAAAFSAALDGVEPLRGPITIALTTEEDSALDQAACRAGRLTTKIVLDLPDRGERRALWARYLAQVPQEGPIDLERAADRSVGMSGADIAATVLVALGLSMVEGVDALVEPLLDEAILRNNHVQERHRRRGQSADTLRHEAVHETGHALYAALTWGTRSLASITIQPSRGDLGRTVLNDAWADETLFDRRRLRESVGMALAGMVAEELVYGPDAVSLGCVNDLAKGTELLRRLTSDLGGEPVIGPVDLGALERGGYSDRGSDAMRTLLWETVQAAAARHLGQVRETLTPWRPAIDTLAEQLLAAPDATLSGEALAQALQASGVS